MESAGYFRCNYCGRANFSSRRALTQHQNHGLCAKAKAKAEDGNNSSASSMSLASDGNEQGPTLFDSSPLPHLSIPSPPQKLPAALLEVQGLNEQDFDDVAYQMDDDLDNEDGQETAESEEGETDYLKWAQDLGLAPMNSDSDAESGGKESNSGQSRRDSGTSKSSYEGPDTSIRDQFRKFCDHAKRHFLEFTEDEIAAIRLLHVLKLKQSPMNAYEPLMLWHLRSSKKIREHESLGTTDHFIGRKRIIKNLIKRYNFANKMPYQKVVKLPVSGSIVKLTCHDAKASIQRLLTDPRIDPRDYLYWDRDPTKGPPDHLDYVQDLNTGQAYIQTHATLITEKGQVLLPLILYADGTAVSHFHDMELTQVKMALGIFTRQARMRPYFWVPLGYIEKVHEQGGRSRTILRQSNHLDTQDGANSDDSSANIAEFEGVGNKNDQDFHAMMSVILEDLVALQENGLVWDHHNQDTGETWEDLHFITFVPFLRVDGKEADLCCAKYSQRSSTQQICRKCHIPLQRADDHMANYKLKTVSEIKKLVENADLEGLKALSQTYLRNAFYNVRFSTGNDHGIHGSCPSELLHAFLLGTFKYLRDIFFEMIGVKSELAKLINALAKIYGKLFARQSDRTMPGTSFSNGIQVGKLMAKDYRGVLLIMLAIVRSTKGREILKKRRIFKDKHDTALNDWILLIELMLEWEAYLNEPRMYVKDVKRLKKKHRYIMYIMRKVAQRNAGMGLKLLKFHMILHIWEDILQYGVPLEFDTSANESMHKPAKQASRMTQKAHDTFNFQTATRLCEFELLDLALEEIENGRCIWHYFDTFPPDSASDSGDSKDASDIFTGETRISVFWDKENECAFKIHTRSTNTGRVAWDTELLGFLLDLQDLLQANGEANPLGIFTMHRRKDQIFRGHPDFRGKGPWRDWVWVDWGAGWGRLPCHIWCFVVINEKAGKGRLKYGGITLSAGTYAVVETTELEENEMELGKSDLMMPVCKDIDLDEDGLVAKRRFYLADTEAFVDPCCTIPDIGGPPNRYFVVKPRNQWADEFIRWIRDEHHLDEMDELDEVEEDEGIMAHLEEDRPGNEHKSP
jgi:hypothetical protein